jgi:cytochrome bd-type quinol oxidase subunit 2
MRPLAVVVAVALLLVGGIWIAQGAGFLKGSFMTDQSSWLWIGIACAVVGAGLLVATLRSARR